MAWYLDKKDRGAFHTRRNREQLRGSCKAVPHYNINTSTLKVRGTTAEEEQRAYKRLVKTNAIVHRLTTRNIE